MATPIKLGSAAGTSLIFTTGSKITTNDSGVQSVSITALYGDGQNVFSVLPAAGTPFNEVFGNTYLPSDFKVDITGGGFDIEYIEGKAAKVTINFKRPDPTQPPGPLGQRSRKVSFDTAISYKNVGGYAVIGVSGTTGVNTAPDDRSARYGFPEPVVTVTYNIDQQPNLDTLTYFAQPGDIRTAGFPSVGDTVTPMIVPGFTGCTVAYFANGAFVIDGPLTSDFNYRINMLFSSNPLGWRLTKIASQPHADESFFDVTETWQNFYDITGATFVSKTPR